HDQEASTAVDNVDLLFSFLKKYLDDSIVKEVERVLSMWEITSLPRTTLAKATHHIIQAYCGGGTGESDCGTGGTGGGGSDESESRSGGDSVGSGGSGGGSGGDSGGSGEGGESSGSGGSGGNRNGSGGGGGGGGGDGNGRGGNGGFRQPPLTIGTAYTSPLRGNTTVRYHIRQFQQQWCSKRPNKMLHSYNPDSPQPRSLLFHATRSLLPNFQASGVCPSYTKNEFSTLPAFYVSNSLANSVAHALTYQHVPDPDDKPIVVFVFVVDSTIMQNLSTEMKTKIISVGSVNSVGYQERYRNYCKFVQGNYKRTPDARKVEANDFVMGPICVSPWDANQNVGMMENLDTDACTVKSWTYLNDALHEVLQTLVRLTGKLVGYTPPVLDYGALRSRLVLQLLKVGINLYVQWKGPIPMSASPTQIQTQAPLSLTATQHRIFPMRMSGAAAKCLDDIVAMLENSTAEDDEDGAIVSVKSEEGTRWT
ncbi:hypothetical protein GGX14DRAFT_592579, partial [Mycena pura]